LSVRAAFPDLDWYRGELAFPQGSLVAIERFLASEPGIRAELHAWAGYLETRGDTAQAIPLMERMIQSSQMFTIEGMAEPGEEEVVRDTCVAIAQFLAQVSDGIYQIDEQGFFATDGTLLVREG
jgi:hypothetical protein